tara:strand:+ start:424 stop:702 length:279 start_codon:yes stop_codon:yes gene_type:complete
MKYFIGKIQEQYGEFKVEQSILFCTSKDPTDVLEEIAKDWYGLDEHDSFGLPEGMYWNDVMAYGAGSHHEITATAYAELKDGEVFTELYGEQ